MRILYGIAFSVSIASISFYNQTTGDRIWTDQRCHLTHICRTSTNGVTMPWRSLCADSPLPVEAPARLYSTMSNVGFSSWRWLNRVTVSSAGRRLNYGPNDDTQCWIINASLSQAECARSPTGTCRLTGRRADRASHRMVQALQITAVKRWPRASGLRGPASRRFSGHSRKHTYWRCATSERADSGDEPVGPTNWPWGPLQTVGRTNIDRRPQNNASASFYFMLQERELERDRERSGLRQNDRKWWHIQSHMNCHQMRRYYCHYC